MTSRERILEAIRRGNPDRVPVSPFTLGALDYDNAVTRELIEKTDPFINVASRYCPFTGSAAKTEVIQDGDTSITIYETPKGTLKTAFKKTNITSGTTEYAIKTPEDAERFLSMPFAPAKVDLSDYHMWRSRVQDEGLVIFEVPDAICFPALWLSPENFCFWWADYPDLLTELTRVAAERINDFVRSLCLEGVDAFRIIGGEFASVQLGPSGFDKLVTPFDSELVDIMHFYGAVAYYHNHGPVTKFMDRLVSIGMDALDPLEAAPWGDIEIGEAVKKFGDKVCLVGNLDDMEIIEQLPTGKVVELAEERLSAAGDYGFILGGTASGTYTERGARNFIAMADMVRARVCEEAGK